jgi:hypothetical protein|tara:strand:+ start:535 stop:843 length:309 start_codon:yes stop_codon:yes gene_type:complete
MPIERKVRDLVCESLCNHGIVQEFDAVVVKAHKLCHQSERMEARFIPPGWLETARSFVHTKHTLLRRELAPLGGVEYGPIVWEWIWGCAVCGGERVYGRDAS